MKAIINYIRLFIKEKCLLSSRTLHRWFTKKRKLRSTRGSIKKSKEGTGGEKRAGKMKRLPIPADSRSFLERIAPNTPDSRAAGGGRGEEEGAEEEILARLRTPQRGNWRTELMHTKRHARNVIIANLWTQTASTPTPPPVDRPVSIVEITRVTLPRRFVPPRRWYASTKPSEPAV